ncbi:MAG: quinone oxidoreductase [Armatimonadetes bacterium]|nr:quinone oxidoreductase [Armatimonadota bacterium]MDE2207185.1 quinone oxidoreductase [Armatimonadota bacterium]
MQRVIAREYGGPEVLRLEASPDTAPAAGEAAVEMHFAGINFIDIYRRRGGVELPLVPGFEGSGVVAQLGEGVAGLAVGDRVCFTGVPGAYSTRVIAPASRLMQIPSEMGFDVAAAWPLQGMTAHYLLHEYRLVGPGVTVLIHAAAGGMGLLLCAWAAHLGATVIGTVSTSEKAHAAAAAGAHHTILYTTSDFVEEVHRLTNGRGADLIIDGVGNPTGAKDLAALADRGTVVFYGSAGGAMDPIVPTELLPRCLRIAGGNLAQYTADRNEAHRRASAVLAGIAEGWLQPRIGRIYALADAATAHADLESRRSIGKLLLQMPA